MAFRPGLARFRGTALGDQGAGFLIPAALLHQRILATEQDPSRAQRVAARWRKRHPMTGLDLLAYAPRISGTAGMRKAHRRRGRRVG